VKNRTKKLKAGGLPFALLLLLTCCRANKPVPLKELFAGDFIIGSALGSRDLNHDYIYPMRRNPSELAVLVREFGCVTPENLMKWEYLQPYPGFFNFDQADEFVAFAEKHHMDVVGHVLVWHSQLPDWVFKDTAGKTVSREELIKRMRTHIHTVMKHYRGRIKYWDVVNEAVIMRMKNGKSKAVLRPSPWMKIIGSDYIALAFKFAHEADPNAHLLYNDFNMTDPEKARFVAEMVRCIKARGIPVHGIGMQGHWHLEYPTGAELQQAIDTYAKVGVKVSITELDIGVLPLLDDYHGADISHRAELRESLNPYTKKIPPEILKQQAEKYTEIFRVLLKNRNRIERVTFWGISDRYSWRNDYPISGRTAHPLLFDRDFRPKPAYFALQHLKKDR